MRGGIRLEMFAFGDTLSRVIENQQVGTSSKMKKVKQKKGGWLVGVNANVSKIRNKSH